MSLTFKGKRQHASELRQLFPVPARPLQTIEMCLVLVPDVSTKSPKLILDSFWASLQSLIPPSSESLVLGFEYGLSSDFESIWNSLALVADKFIDCLIAKQNILLTTNIPFLFVCHGLGGLVVKQALVRVYKPYGPPTERRIRQGHSGTVFIATPHPTYSRKDAWHKLILILRGLKLSRIQRSQAELESTIVANISRQFEQCIIDTHVASIYETQVTKVSSRIFDSEKFVLVDRAFAETGVPYEKLIEAHSDHNDLLHYCARSIAMRDLLQGFVDLVRSSFRDRRVEDVPTDSSSELVVNDDLAESIWVSVTRDESPDGQPGTDEAVHQSASDRSGLEIATLAQFTPTEKTLKIPYYMLKPAAKNQHFIGRKDILRRIDELLLPTADLPAQESYGSPRVFAIHGLGGVGKTEVAREYALSRQQQFDAIFWVEADQTTQLSEGFSIIAAQLGFADSADQDRVVSRNITLEWLANPQISPGSRDSSLRSGQNACEYEARWLLIFNNADDLELLRIFWPLTQTGSILVTSRDPMVKRGRAGLELEPFETDEAATLLRTLTEFEDSPENREASTALAIRLGGLPLAITQIAALIDRWEMTLPEFLAHFDKQISIATMAKEKHENLPDSPYYKHSLLTVWALDSLIPEASAILQVLSFLSPDSIRESLLSATIPFTQAPASYPTLDEDFIRARSDLTKTSLVRRDRGEGKLVLHRLVQDVVRSQMDAIAIHSALGFSAQLILHAWPTSFLRFDHDIGTWDKSEELLPHILKLRDHFQTYLPGIESVEAKQNFAKLLLFAGWYLFERMDYDAAKPLFLAILGMPRDDSLRMDELRADALFALAALSTQINETKERTIAYAEQHLVYRRALRDGTRFREDRLAMAHGELAQAQLIAGEYEDAILNANIAIELTLPSPAFLNGDDWPTFAETHKAFALAALGRYADALDAIDRNLDYWMAHAHERYPFQLGIVYRCLGFVRRRQGMNMEKGEAYMLALKYFNAAAGDKSHYVGQMCSHLGAHHADKHEYETSSLYFEQALRVYRAHSYYAAELAWTLFRQSQSQEAAGDIQRAAKSLAEACDLYTQIAPVQTADVSPTAETFESLVPLMAR